LDLVIVRGVVYTAGAGNTVEENSGVFSLNPNALVSVSKVMLALVVKLCSSKILQFLTGGAG